MEMRDLLEKMMKFAGEKVGQKPGEQWRGSDKAPPGKKLVGDSILKDLSKGKTPKTKEQELSEEFQAFLEAEFKDTNDKRPGRKSDRPHRGHKAQSGYKTIKTDEAVGQEYTVVIDRKGRERPVTGTMEELLDYFGYTLEVGKSYEHERGRYKINMAPKNIQQLVDALNKAVTNAAANSAPSTYYSVGESQVAEGVPYKATNEYPALKDPVVAKVVKQMRPGLGLVGLDMANEAFLYYAYELGKDRARADWELYYPAIRQAYMMDKSKHAKALEEGWESGPEEYKEPYDDTDDAYDRQRQEKIDTEAEKEWAKLPKVSTYKLLGRGPNMEPNYEFGGKEYDTLEAAIEARKQLMADPSTPHPEHIGIQTLTRVVNKEQTDEAIDSDIVQPMGQDTFNRAGYNPIRNERDYLDTLSKLTNLSLKPGLDQSMKDHITQRIRDLNAEAFKKGFIKAESRGHKIVATKLKDIERSKNFRVPSAEERRELAQRMKDFEAQLAAKKTKKQVKEYGAETVSPYGQPTQKQDPKQAQQAAANLNIQKTALNQLKQINPEIDPLKAATAMTKDPETMNPQEKEAAAQVAKTVSPALGSPAFGSLKTAIQKIQTKK